MEHNRRIDIPASPHIDLRARVFPFRFIEFLRHEFVEMLAAEEWSLDGGSSLSIPDWGRAMVPSGTDRWNPRFRTRRIFLSKGTCPRSRKEDGSRMIWDVHVDAIFTDDRMVRSDSHPTGRTRPSMAMNPSASCGSCRRQSRPLRSRSLPFPRMDRSMVIAKGRTKQLADGSVLYRFGDEQTPSAGLDQVERETQEQIAYCEQNGSHDLLVVGPGVLGSLVALGWKSRFPEAKVVGQTNTNQAHERLRSLGVEPRTKFERDATQFPYVVFSAPPSGSEDYPQEITDAVKLWNGKGGFVFTSSAGVYLENNLGSCKESSPLQLLGSSERLDKLLLAEEIVHKVGGNVLRLAGLYTADRGAHMFFLKAGQVPRTGDNVINLIHNEDAASLTISTLLSSKKAKYYLGCDNHPITLSEMMDIILTSGKYEGSCEFVGKDPPTGKCLNNDKTREELSWSPKHESFQSFVNKI